MKRTLRGSVVVALGVILAILALTVVPSYAQRGGGGGGGGGRGGGGGSMGGSMGGGGSWRGGGGGGGNWQGGGGGNWRGGSWNGGGNWKGGNWNGGWRGAGWGWRGGGWGWRGGGWGWWGPGVVVGAGFAPYYWGTSPWYPYGYPYGYGYPYAPYGYPSYSAPVVLESGAQTYIEQAAPAPPQPQAQFWYYCQNPQGYYPYVGECPGGWQPVPAQPAQPR